MDGHTAPPKRLQARCLCGAVRLELQRPAPEMVHCHCRACRRFGGGAMATTVEIAAEHLEVTQGAQGLSTYRRPGKTDFTFCSLCGSSLYGTYGDSVYVWAGALEGDPGIRPQRHIHVAGMAPWYEITDRLPQSV